MNKLINRLRAATVTFCGLVFHTAKNIKIFQAENNKIKFYIAWLHMYLYCYKQ